jgi:hypothetical protein
VHTPPHPPRNGAAVPYTFLEGPDVWYAADQLARQDEWLHVVNDVQIAELESAIEGVLKSGLAKLDDTGKYLNFVSDPALDSLHSGTGGAGSCGGQKQEESMQ